MSQQLRWLKTGNMPAMIQSTRSLGVCVCLWQSRFMVVVEAQTKFSRLAVHLAIRLNSQATSTLYGRLNLVQDWVRGSPAAIDIIVTSPLTPAMLRDASTSAGSAAFAAECRKHEANDIKCQELGWTCIPLAVETFGHWGEEAQAVFSRLGFVYSHPSS